MDLHFSPCWQGKPGCTFTERRGAQVNIQGLFSCLLTPAVYFSGGSPLFAPGKNWTYYSCFQQDCRSRNQGRKQPQINPFPTTVSKARGPSSIQSTWLSASHPDLRYSWGAGAAIAQRFTFAIAIFSRGKGAASRKTSQKFNQQRQLLLRPWK